MKLPSVTAAVVLGLALSVPAAPEVRAAYSGIQRCKAADGTTVYTDKPCTLMGAAPSAMSGELQMRLASDPGADTVANASFSTVMPATPVGRRSAAAGCARTPTQLAMDIQGSIALRDVNRLAESYQWAGMRHRESIPVMQQLDRMARSQVVATQYFDAQMGMGLSIASADESAAHLGRTGVLQVQMGGAEGAQSVELNVEQYQGCYFVRF